MTDFLEGRGARRLSRLILWTRTALLAERLARALAPATIVAGLFVALSLSGCWLGAPSWVRIVGVVFFAAALLAALVSFRHFRAPSLDDARHALDATEEFAPAVALSDRLANAADPRTLALWRLHRAQAESHVENLRAIAPRPELWRLDRRALGALTVLLLCVSLFIAGPEAFPRLAAVFDWRFEAPSGAVRRVDAWIDPPAYTGLPPIALRGASATPIVAPIGSLVVVRAARPEDLRIVTKGGLEPSAVDSAQGGGAETHFVLRGDGEIGFGAEGAHFSLRAAPDAAPKISLLGVSKPLERGGFVVSYRLEDDYGVHDAEATALPPEPRAGAHPLYDPPSGPLELAPGPGGLGEGKTTLDWTDSPFAGDRLDLALSVHDDAGQQGVVVVKNFILPEKKFNDPLARALVEQRRTLALDAGAREKVMAALEALMLAPEQFSPDLGVYLGLRYAASSLRDARSDEDLRGTVAFLWQLALAIEDGDLPQAERDFRAAERALREAVKNGASPQEIARLTEELKKALQNFLSALRAQQQQRGDNDASGGEKELSQQDLQSMLDQMANSAQNGDKQSALSALDQINDLLNRLKSGGSRASGRAAQARKMMRDLDGLMREQQKLRDDTLVDSTGERQQGESAETSPPSDQPAEAGAENRAARQNALRRQLDALQSQKGAPEMQDAEGAMRQSEDSLRRGDDAGAGEAQGRALDALRQAASELAKQGDQGQQGPGGRQGGVGYQGREGDGRGGIGSRNAPIDASTAQKARKVLEELRRRLADPQRARDELDYLERLLRPD